MDLSRYDYIELCSLVPAHKRSRQYWLEMLRRLRVLQAPACIIKHVQARAAGYTGYISRAEMRRVRECLFTDQAFSPLQRKRR